ncbi:MAG: hypothetical protein ACOCVF_01530 [bacterium]
MNGRIYVKYYDDDDMLKEYELMKKMKSHNIIRERVELYKDFTINLINYIYDTYLGNEYINKEDDIRGHFDWCYNKVLDEFLEEEINFHENNDLYYYFYQYFYTQFYEIDKEKPLENYIEFWENIFNIQKKNKNKRVFDILLELYEIFDISINYKIKEKEEFIF